MVNVVYALVFVWLLSPGTILLRSFQRCGASVACPFVSDWIQLTTLQPCPCKLSQLWFSQLKLCFTQLVFTCVSQLKL